MTDQLFHKSLRYYQSANADAQSVKDDFLIRIDEFDIIMDDIRHNPMKGSVQHYLLLGRRGSGKSTLLKRIQVEIDSDAELNRSYIAINLAEEQANIFRLFDLLNEIIEELEEKGVTVDKPDEADDCNLYTRNLFGAIHKAIEQSHRKVVLLLDNIDRIFENLREDNSLVREMLLNFDDIKIIGGSTKMTEHFWKHDQPFYQFFRVLELPKLNSEEIKTLLINWSKKLDMPALAEFVEKRPGQLETVRLLTDGLPRTLQFFVNILINNSHEQSYEYLKQIMDQVTPLYQERLNNLPASQRKIVLQMAFIWESAGTKDIAAATLINNNVVSAQLKQLTEKGITEKIETNTKNHLYRLSERFFNLWLIFTQGSPKEKRRAKCLTIFMENFYDGDGLRNLALSHLRMIREHKISSNKAAIITKALAQSKFISSETRDELIDETLLLEDIVDELRKQIPPTISSVTKEIELLVNKKEWERAIKLADTIEQEDGVKDFLIGTIWYFSDDYERAIRSYLRAIEKGSIDAQENLGELYFQIKNYQLAEQNYLQAIEKGSLFALKNICILYRHIKNYAAAEKYLLIAVAEKLEGALNNLALLYAKLKKDKLAEKYYFQAIEQGDNDALFNIGTLYAMQKEYNAAEKYFLQSIEKGIEGSHSALAFLYYEQGINKKKTTYLTEQVSEGEFYISIPINAWNGKIDLATDQLNQLISIKDYSDLDFILEHLLYHRQVNLVNNLFGNPKFGTDLKERFELIYYAVKVLLGKDENIILKIPPEIKETVDELLNDIKEKQKFYYR